MTELIVYATKCAMLNGSSAGGRNNNYGLTATFQTGGGITAFTVRGIMQFDLSSLDPATIINSAYVSLFSATVLSAQGAQLVELPAGDAGWVDGDESSPPVGMNCWNWHTYDTVGWVGGPGAEGGTFIANFDTPVPQGVEVQIILPIAMVQAWVGPAGVNPGLNAKAQAGIQAPRAMWSNNAASVALYPRLTLDVTYPSPPVPDVPESASALIIEYSLDGINYIDISGETNEIDANSGRITGEAYDFSKDTAAITLGKREDVVIKIRVLYKDEASSPVAVFREKHENDERIWIRWSPKGGGVGNSWFTTVPDCVILNFGYPLGDADSPEPLMVELSVATESLVESVMVS